MPGIKHNTLKAIRDALVGDGTLTELVPAAKIRTGSSPTPTEFPCITLDFDGGRNGYPGTRGGTLFVTIYSADDQPTVALYAIEDAVNDVLDGNSIDISNADVAIHLMINTFESVVIPEKEIREDVYSIALQYSYASATK